MYADAALITGTRHARVAEACQDFGSSRSDGVHHWGIVSDGCSQAGETSMGARVLTRAMEQTIEEHGASLGALCEDPAQLQQEVLERAEPWIRAMSSPADALATVGAVWASENMAEAVLAGDGFILSLSRDGSIEVIEQTFTANRPLYLAYYREPGRFDNFVKESRAFENSLEVRRSIYDASGNRVSETLDKVYAAADLAKCGLLRYSFTDRRADLMALLVATDGVASRPGMPTSETIVELLQIRSFNGQFLRRRIGALGAQWAKSSTFPKDDLTVAGVSFFEDSQES